MTLRHCRDCGELAAMEPAFHGRCSWCHYLATHPEYVPPWWRRAPATMGLARA